MSSQFTLEVVIAYLGGSVRDRPIATIPDVKMPSVNIVPKKFYMFGVRRKGTTSLVAKTGLCLRIPGV